MTRDQIIDCVNACRALSTDYYKRMEEIRQLEILQEQNLKKFRTIMNNKQVRARYYGN